MLQRVKHLNIFSSHNTREQTRITVLVLFALAILIYAPLIGWGVPHANAPDRTKTYAVDEILPLEGLAEMHNTFVISKPDRNYFNNRWYSWGGGIYLLLSRNVSAREDFVSAKSLSTVES